MKTWVVLDQCPNVLPILLSFSFFLIYSVHNIGFEVDTNLGRSRFFAKLLEEILERLCQYLLILFSGKIHYTEVFDMLRSIDPPLGFGKKCPERQAYKKLIRMNMPMDKEGKVRTILTFITFLSRFPYYTFPLLFILSVKKL